MRTNTAKKKHAELLLTIEQESSIPLYAQIYEQIKDLICSGHLKEGMKLPSIRHAANEIQVSHTTVEQAYSQLSAEGLVNNVPRSGYVVSHIDSDFMSHVHEFENASLASMKELRNTDAFYAENRKGSEARYDFSYANLRPGIFPTSIWCKLTSEVLHGFASPDMSRYPYADEPGALSIALADHLSRSRGTHCLPEQVLPQAGTDGAISTVLQLFDQDNDVLGIEEPGYATVREVAERHGFKIVAIPSDKGERAFLDALTEHDPKIVFSTPSHQFPTGNLMSLNMRTQFLKWAERNDSFIIEDDSCNEYRYRSKPIRSLQSLDCYGRVIYLGSISKTLSPALRIAYLILPPTLLERYLALFNHTHPSVSKLDQEVLAKFISKGHWNSHIRRVSNENKRCHDELLRCLRAEFGETLEVSGIDTGMHFYVSVHNGMSQRELLRTAFDNDVMVYGTSRMWFSSPPPQNKIMLGFSAIRFEDIEPGVNALRRAWLDR